MAERITKDSIIKALLDTAFMRSAGATSLSDVADNLKIKKASLYNHFDSRDDIVDSTMKSCREYISSITFVPSDIESVTTKYPPETVLKGIVNRYFKMHEKSPMFQIYTFVESQKYFSAEASDIVREEKEKLVSQTEQVLISLAEKGKLKLTDEEAGSAALWFCSGIANLMDLYLQDRKKVVMENPAAGEGELFALPADENGLSKVDEFVEQFVSLLK